MERPKDTLCDLRTGVICSPNNYAYDPSEGELDAGYMRLSGLADYERWMSLDEDRYQREKLRWYDRMTAAAVRYVPDFRRRVIATDLFTPKTVRRFTFHDNGAVLRRTPKTARRCYPSKQSLPMRSDQGFVGIVGAIFSGISIANQHCLRTDL